MYCSWDWDKFVCIEYRTFDIRLQRRVPRRTETLHGKIQCFSFRAIDRPSDLNKIWKMPPPRGCEKWEEEEEKNQIHLARVVHIKWQVCTIIIMIRVTKSVMGKWVYEPEKKRKIECSSTCIAPPHSSNTTATHAKQNRRLCTFSNYCIVTFLVVWFAASSFSPIFLLHWYNGYIHNMNMNKSIWLSFFSSSWSSNSSACNERETRAYLYAKYVGICVGVCVCVGVGAMGHSVNQRLRYVCNYHHKMMRTRKKSNI